LGRIKEARGASSLESRRWRRRGSKSGVVAFSGDGTQTGGKEGGGGASATREEEEKGGLAEGVTRARRRRAARRAGTGEGEGEAGWWAVQWGGAHPSVKRGEMEREWQVGPAVIELNSK
jgi:hypothetical protein